MSAQGWISTDPTACMQDVLSLGAVSAAAEHQMALIVECIERGDDRWRDITLRQMAEALSAEFVRLLDSTDWQLNPEESRIESACMHAEWRIISAINDGLAMIDKEPLSAPSLTDEMVQALKQEAATAGDASMVACCSVWLTDGEVLR